MYNNIRISLLILSLGLANFSAFAQSYRATNNIPVKDLEGNVKAFAWSGGMNNPQFSVADLNLDGHDDLIFYDRSDATFTTFINKGIPGEIGYTLEPKYAASFDSCNCDEFALLEDYNCDGLPDLFCGGISPNRQNIALYRQVIYNGDSVGFELDYFTIDVLSNNLRPIYNTPTDIPAIVDADGDGDIDIISTQTGSNFFTLHTNLAMEKYGRCDTMDFVIGTSCWGHFYEGNNDNTIVVADTVFCKRGGPSGRRDEIDPRHVGSTLLVQDFDGDGLVDAMLGDVSYSTVNVVYNGGDSTHAFMDSVVYEYPDYDSAVYQVLFPGIFYVDLDNDGVRDMLFAPNAGQGAENVDGTLHYLNKGLDNFLDLEFQGRGIFSAESIDAGRASNPTFIDYNDDGLQDILIGSSSANLRNGDTTDLVFQLQLYENIGSLEDPEFKLVDDDYLNASTLFPPLQAAAPVAADMDGDGDDDLLIGQIDGKVRYFENAAGPGQKAAYIQITNALTDNLNQTIDVGNISAPAVFDLDGDNDLDLFIGNSFGIVAYYENTGSVSSATFTAVADTFGGIKVFDEFGGQFKGASKPRFADYDGDNKTELLVGAEDGFIYIYEDPAAGLTSSIAYSSTLFGHDFGEYAAPAMAPLDLSGDLFYVVGSNRGGLQMWNNRPEDTMVSSVFTIKELPRVSIFPNPARESVTIEWPGNPRSAASVKLLNSLGQEVSLSRGINTVDISLEQLSSGMYIVLVEQEDRRWTGRLVKE